MSQIGSFSGELRQTVKKAAASVVTVRGGEGYPSSGTAYAPDLVITAAHAVRSDEGLLIVSGEGREIEASLVGRDAGRDLAVLRAADGGLVPAAPAGETPSVGEIVIALARPTSDGIQASLGIVSIAPGRYRGWAGPMDGVFRTDATRFAGFAGGPLVQPGGEVVGINILGDRPGMSVTLPSAPAWECAERILEHGSVRQGYLGVRSQVVHVPSDAGVRQRQGLLIVAVDSGSPADEGGLMVGDILIRAAESPLERHQDLVTALAADVVGRDLPLQILRGGKGQSLTVRPGEIPGR
jgi:S1-C subfamily serine protease